MKKIIAIAFAWAIATSAMACDICGCSIGGNYFGILPQFQRNFAGVRYTFKSFETEHPPLFSNEIKTVSAENFHTTEFWGRYVPHTKVQLFASVPVSYFQKTDSGHTIQIKGLGDVMLLGNYVLLNTGNEAGRDWKHALQMGGGIKLPTGAFEITPEGEILNPNMQPGTGSFDFPMNFIYTVRYKRTGINTEFNYQAHTSNKNGYRFGNRFSTSVRAFYWQQVKALALLPSVGLAVEHAQADLAHGLTQEYTGGGATMASAGTDFYLGRISLGLNLQQPIRQQVGNGYIKTKTRLGTNLIFLF